MFGLPQSTEYGKRIPKQKFYENISVTPSLKRVFIDQIKTIRWTNKIAASTINLAEGKNVSEIEVFEITLNTKALDENVLRQIDREVPYHILYILRHEAECQTWIGYKEAAESGSNAFKVVKYYHTDWRSEADIDIQIEGLSLDEVYENLVRRIAGNVLQMEKQECLKASIERDNRRQGLQKQIATLQMKVRKEKQLNKQVQLNTELKRLKTELEEM